MRMLILFPSHIAPAVLDPEEDPGIYDSDESSDDNSNNNRNLRLSVFKTLLSLPDAFGVPIARRIYDGRNMTEALLNQTAKSSLRLPAGDNNNNEKMKDNNNKDRIEYLVNKYTNPVREFPNEWDVGLLNVYRAGLLSSSNNNNNNNAKNRPSSGRRLLDGVRKKAKRLDAPVCVVSGKEDRIVPPKASKKIVELLSQQQQSSLSSGNNNYNKNDDSTTTTLFDYIEIDDTGHLPMDERPNDLARIIANFIRRSGGKSSEVKQ